MQRDRLAAARLWLSNAETDLELAREIAGRYASRACFHAQQSAEMALKGLLIALADDHPRTHIGDGLVRELEALGEVVPPGIIAAANPDALGGADPRKVLVSADARRSGSGGRSRRVRRGCDRSRCWFVGTGTLARST